MTARECKFNIVCVAAAADGVSGSVLLEAGGSQVSGFSGRPHPPAHVNGKCQSLLLPRQRHVCNCFCRCNSMSQKVSPGWLLSTDAVLAASSRLSAPPGYRPSWHVPLQPSSLHAPMSGLCSATCAHLCHSWVHKGANLYCGCHLMLATCSSMQKVCLRPAKIPAGIGWADHALEGRWP